jgi:hypothetical protein
MVIASPKHRLSLWLLANLAWVALVHAAALYFHRQLLNGAYPPEADSIGLPIMGIAMWVLGARYAIQIDRCFSSHATTSGNENRRYFPSRTCGSR